MKRITTLVILILAMAAGATAQQSRWSVFAGWNLAVGPYGTVGDNAGDWALTSAQSDRGGAGFGSDLGVSYRYRFGDSSDFGIVFNAEYLYSSVCMKIKTDNLMSVFNQQTNCGVGKISNPGFHTVPFLGGIFFETGLKEDRYKLYFDLQAGVTISCISDYEVEFRGASSPIVVDGTYYTDYCFTNDYQTKAVPAFRFGVGLLGNKHVALDMSLLCLAQIVVRGTQEYDYTYAWGGTASQRAGKMDFIAGTITPMYLTFRIGYNF